MGADTAYTCRRAGLAAVYPQPFWRWSEKGLGAVYHTGFAKVPVAISYIFPVAGAVYEIFHPQGAKAGDSSGPG